MRISGCAIIVATVLAFRSGAAAPVTWHLDGVTFTDGGVANGSFDYDAATNTTSNIAMRVADGDVATFPPTQYTFLVLPFGPLFCAPDGAFVFGTLDRPGRQLRFGPIQRLPESGGTIPLDLTCLDDNLECYNCGTFRGISAGRLTAGSIAVQSETWGRIKARYADR